MVCPPMVPVDDNRGVQVDGTPPIDDMLVDENPTEPLVEPQLRRSTKERQLSTRYSASEYVILTNEGELKRFCPMRRNVNG